jgi:hypothetical protein
VVLNEARAARCSYCEQRAAHASPPQASAAGLRTAGISVITIAEHYGIEKREAVEDL